MKKTYVGKAGKIKVYGTNPGKYFNTLIEKSANARKGYDEEITLHFAEKISKTHRTLKVESEKNSKPRN